MDSLGVVFLGVIALASVVQAACVVGLIVAGLRMAKRLDALQDRVDREIRPTLDSLSRVTRNLSEVSDLAVLQARRIDDLLADSVGKIEETLELVRRVVVKPLGPVMQVTAVFKGIRRGLEVFQQLRGIDNERRGSARHYAEDEHLFI